jgi:PAP2 superfamily
VPACERPPLAPDANEVVTWNETTMKAILANGQKNVVSSRRLAMVQGAVHDAVSAINRRYDAYYFEGPGDPAMADAYIAGFKIRYVYDLWRPVTAIREGDNDGNDATAGDPTWDSHQNTPAVSDYPSTQSTFSAAAAVVLASLLGDQMAFTFTSGKPFDGITRSFTSFSQAARESADSRVYAGIHFRSACEDGLALGRKVGQRVVNIYLQPVRK